MDESNENEDPVIEEDEEIVEEEGLKDKIKKLRKDLAVCRKERDDYLAGWQRAKADFINARRDEEKLRADILGAVKDGILTEFLEIADSMELALKSSHSEGLKQIYGQLLEILKRNKVSGFKAEGQKFDPSRHEALEREETEDKEKDGMVLEEYAKGYMAGDKLLRAAKVKVGVLSAKGGSASGGKK